MTYTFNLRKKKGGNQQGRNFNRSNHRDSCCRSRRILRSLIWFNIHKYDDLHQQQFKFQ